MTDDAPVLGMELRLVPTADGGRRTALAGGNRLEDRYRYRPNWGLPGMDPPDQTGALVLAFDRTDIAPGSSAKAVIVPVFPTLFDRWRRVEVGDLLPMYEGPNVCGHGRVLWIRSAPRPLPEQEIEEMLTWLRGPDQLAPWTACGAGAAVLAMPDRIQRLVVPFYLDMMRFNAIDTATRVAPAIVAANRSASTLDVIALLRDSWRPLVMGAWLSVLHGEEDGVAEQVLQALRGCCGDLTAPPLVTAAIVLAGTESLPTLESYLQRDLQHRWGASGFVTAAIRTLQGSPSENDESRQLLEAMLEVAHLLRRLNSAPD